MEFVLKKIYCTQPRKLRMLPKTNSLGFIFYLVLVLSLFISGGQALGADTHSCFEHFSNTNKTEWHSLIKSRALAIIEHQNILRAQAGLPLISSIDYAKNLKKIPPKIITPDRRYIIVKSSLVLVGMSETMAFLNLKVDDVYSLNYVYRFDGTKLIEAIPASIFYISQMSETINLYRGLSESEAQLWRRGDLQALKSPPKAIKWGYPMPVVHLSTTFFHSQTSSLIFNVPREVLLRWAKMNLITIGSEGYLHGKPYRLEIVVKDFAWPELLKFLI